MDEACAQVLVRRARLAQRVALWKTIRGQPRRDPHRESRVRDHYAAVLRPAGWSDEGVNTLLAAIIRASQHVQESLPVAIQGGLGSWSEESLYTVLPTARHLSCRTFDAAVDACRRAVAAAAWLPVENSTIGPLHDVQAAAKDLEPWLEWTQPVGHALLARPGVSAECVERIEGHPRALEQCRATLDASFPRTPRTPVEDGAASAACLAVDSRVAIVGSARIGVLHGFEVIRQHICDRADNSTTFRLYVRPELL